LDSDCRKQSCSNSRRDSNSDNGTCHGPSKTGAAAVASWRYVAGPFTNYRADYDSNSFDGKNSSMWVGPINRFTGLN